MSTIPTNVTGNQFDLHVRPYKTVAKQLGSIFAIEMSLASIWHFSLN